MARSGSFLSRRSGANFPNRVPPLLLAVLLIALALAKGTRAEAGLRFAAPFLSFDTGSRPNTVAIADLNRDGKPDLVTANAGSATVSVLLGNGDGTFAAKTDFTTGSGPQSVAIGDLNGDARPDLAVADAAFNKVSVLLGNGDGTFQVKKDFWTATNPYSVAIGDF